MTVRIVSLTHHGMGRGDDGVLYPRALPEEVIEPRADGFAILTPSPDRVAPPCRHYRQCGGCAMQHAADSLVSDWKAGIVAGALRGQELTAPVLPTVTSPPRSRRRVKLAGRRTKQGAEVGFHARASGQIVPTPDCQLAEPSIQSLFPALLTLTTLAATRTTEIALTITATLDGADILVTGARDLTPDLRAQAAQWAGRHPVARLVWNDEVLAQITPPAVAMGAVRVSPPAGAFLQATDHAQQALTALVLEGVGPARRVVDLFAGCGTFSLPLAAQADVHAVEGDAAMLAALDRGWRGAPGLHRITTEPRDLFRRPLTLDDLKSFDAAVIDPPRAGAEAQVAELARHGPPTIVMVSCNPVTFARDARALCAGGYLLGPVTPVDQFRWSAHVELVATFTKA